MYNPQHLSMYIEKHLYRISEKALKHDSTSQYCTLLGGFTCLLSLVFLVLLIAGYAWVLPNNHTLSECLTLAQKENNFLMSTDAVHLIYNTQIAPQTLKKKAVTSNVMQNSECTIIKNLNTSDITEDVFKFSFGFNLISFTQKERELLAVNNYTFIFKEKHILKNMLYGMNTLLTNEIIQNTAAVFPQTQNLYIQSSSIVASIQRVQGDSAGLLTKLYMIGKLFVYYTVVSVFSAIYIYSTIICSPALIIMVLLCVNVFRHENFKEVYRLFPWIGLHENIRNTSPNPNIRKETHDVCMAMLLYFIVMYFVYYVLIVCIASDLIRNISQRNVLELFYGYIAMIEFAAIVFMRTRPFVKYFPVMTTLMMMTFLCYFEFCNVGFKTLAFFLAMFLNASLFCFMVIKLEIPAQNDWDVIKNHVPSSDRPRIGFIPIFHMNWINNIPEEWSVMLPLFGRDKFSTQELALVNKNYEVLDEYLTH